MRILAGMLLLLLLAGCNSGGEMFTALENNPASLPDLSGSWEGDLPDGRSLYFSLDQRDSVLIGAGGVYLNQDAESVQISGGVNGQGQALLRLEPVDEDSQLETIELALTFTGASGTGTARTEGGPGPMTLTRPASSLARQEPVIGARLWDNVFQALQQYSSSEVYRAVVQPRNPDPDLPSSFNFTVSIQGTTLWEWVGGWEVAYDGGSDSGRVAAWNKDGVSTVLLKASDTVGVVGVLFFPQFSSGVAGEVKNVDQSSYLVIGVGGYPDHVSVRGTIRLDNL